MTALEMLSMQSERTLLDLQLTGYKSSRKLLRLTMHNARVHQLVPASHLYLLVIWP